MSMSLAVNMPATGSQGGDTGIKRHSGVPRAGLASGSHVVAFEVPPEYRHVSLRLDEPVEVIFPSSPS